MKQSLFSDEHRFDNSNEVLRKRVAASIIDYLIFFLFTMFLPVLIGEKTATGYRVQGILALLPLLFWAVYFVLIEKIFSGTLGKVLLQIRVESIDGSKLSYVQVLKRRLADLIEIVWCFGLIAYINAKNNTDNKRVGDIWAKTRVVNRNKYSETNNLYGAI